MQIFYPWGKEAVGFHFEPSFLGQIKDLSRQCQSHYRWVEKKRNGSIEDIHQDQGMNLKDEILIKLEQMCDQLKNKEPLYSYIFDQSLMKQSFVAALIAHILGFDYQVQNVFFTGGKWEVKSMIRDSEGNKIESTAVIECNHPEDASQYMGSFYHASKKAFISAVSNLSDLDIVSRFSEVLI